MSRRALVGTCFFVVALAFAGAIRVSGGDAVKKAPVPGKEVLIKADALVKELFSKEYQKAKTDNEQRGRLAVTLLQEGRDTNDYPAAKYVLFREAHDLAAQAGDAPTALQAIEELAVNFTVPDREIFQLKVKVLTTASTATATPELYQAIIDGSLVLLEESLQNDDYPSALKLVSTAEAAAVKLRNVNLVINIKNRHKEVQELRTAYEKVEPFAKTLEGNPKDPKANLVMGHYQALIKGNWEKGLPMFARGSDPSLKALAAKDLAQPKDGPAQTDVAAGWYDRAVKANGAAKTQLLLRSYFWYQQAIVHLKGKDQQLADARMKEITTLLPTEYRVGEIAREAQRFEGHFGPVFGVAFAPDGRKFVTGGQDGSVRLWDVRSGKETRRFEGHRGPVWCVAFAPDGRRIVSGGFDKSIRIWDLVSGREIRVLTGHDDYVRGVAFSQDGRRILSGGDDRLVRLWDALTGQEIRQFKGHDHFVMGVALSRDGRLALSASLDRTVRLWEVESGKQISVLNGHTDTVLAAAFAPDGRHALSGGSDKTLRLWDLETGKTLRVFKGHAGYVHGVAFAPDGRRALSVGSDNSVRLWDVDQGTEIRQLNGHTGQVWSVAFTNDGRWAITCGHDQTARLWGGAK
jgi:hypothetical protein